MIYLIWIYMIILGMTLKIYNKNETRAGIKNIKDIKDIPNKWIATT